MSVDVPLSEIDPPQMAVRLELDEERIKSLADSIDRIGLLHPVTLRRKPDGRYEPIDLLKLPEEVQVELRRRKLEPTIAMEFLRLKDPALIAKVFKERPPEEWAFRLARMRIEEVLRARGEVSAPKPKLSEPREGGLTASLKEAQETGKAFSPELLSKALIEEGQAKAEELRKAGKRTCALHGEDIPVSKAKAIWACEEYLNLVLGLISAFRKGLIRIASKDELSG